MLHAVAGNIGCKEQEAERLHKEAGKQHETDENESQRKFELDKLKLESETKQTEARMCANAQRGGRPAKHRWRPLFNAAKFG